MRSGIVTLVGRPNVGKSSLVNALVGRKLSIVSHKPQTTRHAIQGVLHHAEGQIVFVDTPGLHLGGKRALNRAMNETAAGSLQDVDLAVFVVEAGRWTAEDDAVLERLSRVRAPVGLVVNKVDRVADKTRLLPELEKLSARREFAFVVPLSALRKDNLSALTSEIQQRLPEGPPLYPPDMVVGYDNAFLVTEIVREKLTRTLNQELPYALTVAIEAYEVEAPRSNKKSGKAPARKSPASKSSIDVRPLHRIRAVIWVERDGQKSIVIGQDGSALKRVGTSARKELEYLLKARVFLQLWCRVRENWSDDPKALEQFGLGGA
ncbi:MAG: GTPase Era [Panacagrimonas sp.]|jgi:GTP-binding protein Era|nr:GTPase Era [Panacagrimonas sp.]MCC2655904.1 GTPase Era [Panacagrimonas sp.]